MGTVNKSIGLVEVNSIAYVKEAFSILQQGNIVVPLRDSSDSQRLNHIEVGQIIEPQPESGWFTPVLDMEDDSSIAHIAFTSGTEGEPKAVFLSCAALNNTVARLQQLMQMDDSVREYVGVPVYHSFGYGRCRHVASVGGQVYIPANGFDPLELSRMLVSGEVNALALVPSLLRVLLNQPDILGEGAQSLKWLEIGSQSMTLEEKKIAKRLFPNAVIVQHYGLTEASRTTLLSIHTVPEEYLDSVGKAYDDTCIKIMNDDRIAIKGSHLASQISQEGETLDAFNEEGWFETSDLGLLKDDYLYFLGRADNVINCGGQKLSAERFESALLKILDVIDGVVVSRIPDENYGEGFLISYSDDQITEVVTKKSPECLEALGIKAKSAIRYNQINNIPKTHTGKVRHKVLVEKYLSSNEINEASSDDSFLKIFSDVLNLPLAKINSGISISDIGVDSLQSVQLSIRLEKVLGFLPAGWRELSIQELSDLPRKTLEDSAHETDEKESSSKAKPLWDGSSNMNPQIGFWSLVKEDFMTHEKDFFSQGFFALFVHRFGNARMGIKTKILRAPVTILYRVLRKMTQVFCGIKLDYTVHVGRRVKLEHFGGMIIGARRIGDDVIIRQNTTMGIRDISDLSAKPTIEDGVNIGAGAVIVGDIVVGRHSVIGPNCVVSEDIPPFSVVSIAAPVINSQES